MAGAGLARADFLSLDVEGAELQVLQTSVVPSFGLVMVEEEMMVSSKATIDGVRQLLRRNGFTRAAGVEQVLFNSVWENRAGLPVRG